MATTIKKLAPKQRKPSPVASPSRAKRPAKTKASRPHVTSRADDLAERKKIGKSLDSAGFIAHHKQNSASAEYWQAEG